MEAFIGTIQAFGFNFAPFNWALAQGQLLPISTNVALFSLLGTYYGGNGTSNFALPDLQGRVAIGQGAGNGLPPYDIGQTGGTENATLVTGNLPPHNHLMQASSTSATTDQPNPNYLAVSTTPNLDQIFIYGPTQDTTLNPKAITSTGNADPFPILQPYLAINYSICLFGIFPSRN